MNHWQRIGLVFSHLTVACLAYLTGLSAAFSGTTFREVVAMAGMMAMATLIAWIYLTELTRIEPA